MRIYYIRCGVFENFAMRIPRSRIWIVFLRNENLCNVRMTTKSNNCFQYTVVKLVIHLIHTPSDSKYANFKVYTQSRERPDAKLGHWCNALNAIYLALIYCIDALHYYSCKLHCFICRAYAGLGNQKSYKLWCIK